MSMIRELSAVTLELNKQVSVYIKSLYNSFEDCHGQSSDIGTRNVNEFHVGRILRFSIPIL